jgi:hypothetical protein
VTLLAIWAAVDVVRSAAALVVLVNLRPEEAGGGAAAGGGSSTVFPLTSYSDPADRLIDILSLASGLSVLGLLVSLALVVGLWELQGWARRLAIGWYALSLLFVVASLCVSYPTLTQYITFALSIIALRYLMRPEIRTYFKHRRQAA